MVGMGLRKKKKLLPGAVPTIQALPEANWEKRDQYIRQTARIRIWPTELRNDRGKFQLFKS